MCTVTWRINPSGYDVLFNRDERNERAAESEPHFGWDGDTAYLAPRDGDHGGSWLLVNDRGLTVGLLNDYAGPAPTTQRLSRGQVTLACAAAGTLEDVEFAVERLPLAQLPSFALFAVALDGSAAVWRWRGRRLERLQPEPYTAMLTSSSFEPVAIPMQRRRRFVEFVRRRPEITLELLREFHLHHDPAEGAVSVLMRRPDASTRSVSHISVHDGIASYAYTSVHWADGTGASATAPQLHTRRFNLELAPAERTT